MREPVSPLTISCVFSADTRTTGNTHPAALKRMMESMWRQGSEITRITDATGAEFEMNGEELVFKVVSTPQPTLAEARKSKRS